MAKRKTSELRESLRLQSAQFHLRQAKLDLERERQAWRAERTTLVLQLRELCARYGDNEYPDETSLIEIVRDHLLIPMAAELARAHRRAEPRPVERPSVPALPSGPRAHNVMVTFGRGGWQGQCICGWRSGARPSQEQARDAGRDHERHDTGAAQRDARQRG